MTPSNGSFPRPSRPRAASPAERGAEYAEIQRRLKREAAARREDSAAARESARRDGAAARAKRGSRRPG